MRTTVTIDPDVEALLKKAMRERGEPLKQVLNNAVRDGLRVVHAKAEKPFRQRTFDMGLPLVDLAKANALATELEDQELIAKLRAGR
jgi:hypothetical protein